MLFYCTSDVLYCIAFKKATANPVGGAPFGCLKNLMYFKFKVLIDFQATK
jgi:hypothetical protein